MKRHWRWALPVAAALAAVGAWLFFVYFAFHTILIDEEVEEDLPFFVAGPAPSGMAGDETTEEMADVMNKAMAEADMPMVDEVDEPMPPEMAGAAPSGEADSGGSAAEESPEATAADETAAPADDQTDDTPSETAAPETTQPQIIVEAAGSFISRSHPTEGSARVLGDGSGQRFLRLEDFRTDNGPDLNVYLSAAAADAPASDFDDDFVDLGDLKGNVGSQNYEIPAAVDLDRYSTVTIWCVRFGVVFGAAELAAS